MMEFQLKIFQDANLIVKALKMDIHVQVELDLTRILVLKYVAMVS